MKKIICVTGTVIALPIVWAYSVFTSPFKIPGILHDTFSKRGLNSKAAWILAAVLTPLVWAVCVVLGGWIWIPPQIYKNALQGVEKTEGKEAK